MKCLIFAKRCAKEILRDPLTVIFSLGFPVVLLLLLTAIQANIPVPLFELQTLTPGICIFGLSFISLFSATLIAKDRESAFLQRLYTTPLRAADYILGYALPFLPISLAQSAVCYLLAMALGLPFSWQMLLSLLAILPISLLFIAVGLLTGSVLNTKQVGGICGALMTNLTAWLSGVWFDLELVGGTFRKIAHALPFVHAVELERGLLNATYDATWQHIGVLACYIVALLLAAIALFLRQMRRQ